MKRTTITLPELLAQRINEASAERRVSVSQVARDALEAYLCPEPPAGPRYTFVNLVNAGGYPESDYVEEYLARHWMDDILKRWDR